MFDVFHLLFHIVVAFWDGNVSLNEKLFQRLNYCAKINENKYARGSFISAASKQLLIKIQFWKAILMHLNIPNVNQAVVCLQTYTSLFYSASHCPSFWPYVQMHLCVSLLLCVCAFRHVRLFPWRKWRPTRSAACWTHWVSTRGPRKGKRCQRSSSISPCAPPGTSCDDTLWPNSDAAPRTH